MADENVDRADTLLRRVNRLKALRVTMGNGMLVVDADALRRSDLDVRMWFLHPDATGQWSHGPSGVTASLGECLWAIACTYDIDPGVDA